MSTPTRSDRRAGRFFAGFLLAALLVAGLLSYFASGNPDGLDAVTQTGCETVEVNGDEQLQGQCIAASAAEPVTAGSPLADYTVGGNEGLVGLAGVIGVIVTLLVAGGAFWLLRRPGDRNTSAPRVE